MSDLSGTRISRKDSVWRSIITQFDWSAQFVSIPYQNLNGRFFLSNVISNKIDMIITNYLSLEDINLSFCENYKSHFHYSIAPSSTGSFCLHIQNCQRWCAWGFSVKWHWHSLVEVTFSKAWFVLKTLILMNCPCLLWILYKI